MDQNIHQIIPVLHNWICKASPYYKESLSQTIRSIPTRPSDILNLKLVKVKFITQMNNYCISHMTSNWLQELKRILPYTKTGVIIKSDTVCDCITDHRWQTIYSIIRTQQTQCMKKLPYTFPKFEVWQEIITATMLSTANY